MARHASVVGQVADAYGDLWDVREYRPTIHGFGVCIGWPADQPRGRGGSGGVRAILTAELVAHLESRRHGNYGPAAPELPIGATTIKRLRKALGHNRYMDRMEWWEAHLDELAETTLAAFAERHGVTSSAAGRVHKIHFGNRIRPAGWWRLEPATSLLRGTLPRQMIAEQLDISVGAVGLSARVLVVHERLVNGRRWGDVPGVELA